MVTWFQKLLWDETAFIRYGRAALAVGGALLTAWQINGELTPGLVLSVILGGSGGLLAAGERNPKGDGRDAEEQGRHVG